MILSELMCRLTTYFFNMKEFHSEILQKININFIKKGITSTHHTMEIIPWHSHVKVITLTHYNKHKGETGWANKKNIFIDNVPLKRRDPWVGWVTCRSFLILLTCDCYDKTYWYGTCYILQCRWPLNGWPW